MTLEDQVVVVTGGGTGIGRATARACVEAGARVVLVGRRQEPLEQTCDALCASRRGAARWVRADLTQPGEPARVVAFTTKVMGRLDGLVNNAARFLLEPVASTSDAQLLALFQLNVIALLALCRDAIPALTASQGSIVNISSVVGQGVLPGSVAYAGSKAAVDHITRCLAAELGPAGVRVNCVAPGTTETDMTAGLLADPEAKAQTLAATPLGRVGKAADVAPMIVHLLSREARWVTGQVIQASGGLLL